MTMVNFNEILADMSKWRADHPTGRDTLGTFKITVGNKAVIVSADQPDEAFERNRAEAERLLSTIANATVVDVRVR